MSGVKSVFARSYAAFRDIYNSCTQDQKNNVARNVWIEILDQGGLPAIIHDHESRSNVLVLQFDDVDPDSCVPIPDLTDRSKTITPVLFNRDHAKAIIDFVDAHRDAKVFIVHCTAGICRSGAVASFINTTVFNQPYDTFKNNNRQIRPNWWVEKLLNEQYQSIHPS